jgi:hypothetical protein
VVVLFVGKNSHRGKTARTWTITTDEQNLWKSVTIFPYRVNDLAKIRGLRSVGMFAKLWQVRINFVMPVCVSICTEQLSCHWTDFHEIWYLSIFLKICLKNSSFINPLNAELNPVCYLLGLLAHHFLHISRIRVKSLTLTLLMSYMYVYIYIYIYIWSTYSWCF